MVVALGVLVEKMDGGNSYLGNSGKYNQGGRNMNKNVAGCWKY